MIIAWLQFTGLLLAVSFSGYYLSIFGDRISEHSGLGRSWIGATLIAMVTSLPELGSGIGSVTFANSPDLAMGGVMGSCAFNIALLFIVDWFYRGNLYAQSGPQHRITALMGVLLVGFACLFQVYQFDSVGITIGWVGADSIFLLVLYFVCMRLLYRLEKDQTQDTEVLRDPVILRKSIIGFSISTLVVAGSGLAMPVVGKNIVTLMGWNDAFFGSAFLAVATSLPELVVTISALSIGAVDIALGNLLGSNLFNIATLFVNDLFMPKALFFESISNIHLVTGLSAVIMSALALLGFMLPPRSSFRVGWPSSLILVLYAICMYILYQA